jgi:predicted nucleic acid-binding protein
MAHLLDTNILARLANAGDALNPVATRAVTELRRRGETLCITPQVLTEFRSVATRPPSVNGLGFLAAAAEAEAAGFEAKFSFLPETPAIYPAWKVIVSALGVIGKQVHDARLVAVCHVHAVTHLLTFNVGHFNRLVTVGPPVTVVDPATV